MNTSKTQLRTKKLGNSDLLITSIGVGSWAVEAKNAGALDFTVDDLRARVAAKGDLYAPLLTQRQELPDLSG